MKDGTRQLSTVDLIRTPELRLYNPSSDPVTWMDSHSAAFEADSSMLNYINSLEAEIPAVEGYSPIPDVPQDMSYYLAEYLRAKSPGETEQITGRLRYEQKRTMTASENMSANIVGSLSGTLFGSPEYLPLMFLPITGWGRGALGVGRAAKAFGAARHAKAAAKLGGLAMGEEIVHESLLHQSTLTRTINESYLNVGVAGLFGATVGGVGSAIFRSRHLDALTDEANDAFNAVGVKRMDDYLESNENLVVNPDNSVTLFSDVGAKAGKKNFNSVVDAEAFFRNRAGEEPRSAGAAAVSRGSMEDIVDSPWAWERKWRGKDFMRRSPLRSANISLERALLNSRSEVMQKGTNDIWGHDKPTGATEAGFARRPALTRRAERKIGVRNNETRQGFYDEFWKWSGVDESTRFKNFKAATLPDQRKQIAQWNKELSYALRNNNTAADGNPHVEAAARKIMKPMLETTTEAVEEGMYGYRKVPVEDQDGNIVIENGKMLTRDEPINPIGEVKYGNSWWPKGYVGPKVKEHISAVQGEMRTKFKEERLENAAVEEKAILADKIVKKKEQLTKRKAELQKGIDKAQKEVDAKQKMPELGRREKLEIENAAMKKWRSDLADAQSGLRKVSQYQRNIDKAEAEVAAKIIPPTPKRGVGDEAQSASLNQWQKELLNANNKLKTAKQYQYKIDAAQKKLDDALVLPKETRGSNVAVEAAAMKKWQKELKKAHTNLKNEIKKMETNKRLLTWRSDIIKAERQMKRVGSSKWATTQRVENDLFEGIESDVQKTTGNMIYGKTNGRVYGDKASKADSFKERMVPLHDDFAAQLDLLDDDVLTVARNYYESTIRPTMMKAEQGDPELQGFMDSVTDDYLNMATAAGQRGDTKLQNALLREGRDMVKMNIVARNRYYHRSLVPRDPASAAANISRIMRDFNVAIRMGGVGPTSLSDIGRYNLAKIYAPEIGRFGTTVRDGVKAMKYNKRTMQDFGAAHEVTDNTRAARMMDVDDPHPAEWAATRFADKLAYGLMRSTGLSEFTDYGKLLTANIFQNDLWRVASRWGELTPKTKAKLAKQGFDKELADEMKKEFKRGTIKYIDENKKVVTTNWAEWQNQEMADRFADVIFKESERILGTPNELTMPIWADGEMAKMITQFKSFSLAAHQQITAPMGDNMKRGDILAYQTIATALMMGVITEVIKAAISGEDAWERLEDYTPSDWVYSALDRGALMPLLLMGFNGIDMLSANKISQLLGKTQRGSPSRHSWERGLGPSPALATSLWDIGTAIASGEINERDARTIRRLLPFNNLVWISRALNEVESYAASKLPSSKKSSKKRIYR